MRIRLIGSDPFGVGAALHLNRHAGSNLGEAGARSGNSNTGPVWKLGAAPPGSRHRRDSAVRDSDEFATNCAE